eukprot:s2538_g9.t1
MGKLTKPLQLVTFTGQPLEISAQARLLRLTASPSQQSKGGSFAEMGNVDGESHGSQHFEVVFGMPWNPASFIQAACRKRHPANKTIGVPDELQIVLQKHREWNPAQLSAYRLHWCKRWLKRSTELETLEVESRMKRDAHIAAATSNQRVLLFREILDDVAYEDAQCVKFLECGATLAGDIPKSAVFEELYKPCLQTIDQLVEGSSKRNQAVLAAARSTGDAELDAITMTETEAEIEKGWIEGPFLLSDVPAGATLSRRFPIRQSGKTRLIDDFSISGINDANLLAKTYDLKSAYRQVPIKSEHLKFAFICAYDPCSQSRKIFRLKTMPFGATHSVYNFLRLARALYSVACRGLCLITTNFYDDYILASPGGLVDSSRNGMELLFLLTGWQYAREGSKRTDFDVVRKALGVQFDLSRSSDRMVLVSNTESRRRELILLIDSVLDKGLLGKVECLSLRGRLGFADSYLHGRLGSLTLKKLSEHAYGRTRSISTDLDMSLRAMRKRLSEGKPRLISSNLGEELHVYMDASYEPESLSGGIGGVLIGMDGRVISWFGLMLDSEYCRSFGAAEKGSIIFEFELLAAVVALSMWCKPDSNDLHVWFGDNDALRFSLIKASAVGFWATSIMKFHLEREALLVSRTWFARVATEANISDMPSRGVECELLDASTNSDPVFALRRDSVGCRWHVEPPAERLGCPRGCLSCGKQNELEAKQPVLEETKIKVANMMVVVTEDKANAAVTEECQVEAEADKAAAIKEDVEKDSNEALTS